MVHFACVCLRIRAVVGCEYVYVEAYTLQYLLLLSVTYVL